MLRRKMRWLGIAALATGYPLLAHHVNHTGHDGSLGALVAIAPVMLVALMLAWRSPRRLIMLGAVALSCVVLWAGWPALEHHFGLVFWLQHAAMQLVLFMVFGRTLLGGRKPLCTRFAEMVHAPLSLQHEVYARQVTVAWTLFFAAMTVLSTLLFFLTPLAAWSVFANFLTPLLVVTMFVAEYWIRRWTLPDMRNAHILDAVRAFRDTLASPR